MLAYKHRFHGHNSLRYVYKNNQTVRSQSVIVKFAHNPRRTKSRFAVVVSKKTIKSAVGRNRIRRRMYEIIRKHLLNLKENTDVVVLVVNAEVRTMPPNELETMVVDMLRRARIYKTSSETAIL